MPSVMNISEMPVADSGSPQRDLKVCMPTWRRFDRHAFQSLRYESQDVLAELCDLEMLPLEAGPGFRVREAWHRRLAFRDSTGLFAFTNPGLVPQRMAQDCDVFIATCQTLKELLFVNAVTNWRDRCKVSVCIIDELYAAEVKHSRNLLRLLREFDHVFTELSGSVDAISEVIERPCYCLAPAVDTVRFSPLPHQAPRVVDVHSIGRRRPETHEAFLSMSRQGEIFYVYDTFAGGAEATVVDHRQHRDLIASIAKRSRCFVVAPAKWDVPQETRGQVAVANRYFEGAAAGAVLLGQPSPTEEFRRLLDWPDVVVPTREDGSDAADVLRDLLRDPQRMAAIGRRNAVESLLKHDWSYRWRDLFQHIGMPLGPKLRERHNRLQTLARNLGNSPAAEPVAALRAG